MQHYLQMSFRSSLRVYDLWTEMSVYLVNASYI
uniref:Uncharacterized protein n=1 Tax=Parascaris equorum TaxID=6256 RepID=A0A914R891_PAREQ